MCKNNELLLHAYVDGELDPIRSVEFEEHLKTCSACASELSQLHSLRNGIRRANLYQRAPGSLRARIQAIASGNENRSHENTAVAAKIVPWQYRQRRSSRLEWLVVAAAILVAVVLGIRLIPGIMNARQSDLVAQEVIASHIRSLQPGHLLDVASTDQHTVKPWFNGKLDFSPPVRDLADRGYPLIGGRLDYIGSRDVAALVYQVRKHYINVFIWPDIGTRPLKLPASLFSQGYNMVCWSANEMHLCSVSDVNAADLNQFVQDLQR